MRPGNEPAQSGCQAELIQKVPPCWVEFSAPAPGLTCRAGAVCCRPLRRFLRWSSAAPAVARDRGGSPKVIQHRWGRVAPLENRIWSAGALVIIRAVGA